MMLQEHHSNIRETSCTMTLHLSAKHLPDAAGIRTDEGWDWEIQPLCGKQNNEKKVAKKLGIVANNSLCVCYYKRPILHNRHVICTVYQNCDNSWISCQLLILLPTFLTIGSSIWVILLREKSQTSLIPASQMSIFSGFFYPLWQYTEYLWVMDRTRHLRTSSWALGKHWSTFITSYRPNWHCKFVDVITTGQMFIHLAHCSKWKHLNIHQWSYANKNVWLTSQM